MDQSYSIIHDRHSQPKGILIGYPKEEKFIEFSIHIHSAIIPEKTEELNCLLIDHPKDRSYLTVDQLADFKGDEQAKVDLVKEYLAEHSIDFVSDDSIPSIINCTCTVSDFQDAFHVIIAVYETVNHHSFLTHISPLCAPNEVASVISYVSGLSVEERIERRTPTAPQSKSEDGTDWSAGISVLDLAAHYNFPEDATGKGQCIGIIELGGEFSKSDIETYFEALDIPTPKIKVIGKPPKPKSDAANAEVALDIQIAAALAPDAKIVVYYSKTIIDALRIIVKDKVNKPSVVSISWAAQESNYSESQIEEFGNLLYEAALLGITVIASSGDYGAFNHQSYLNVSMPSSHPYVLGCGGTMLISDDEEIKNEIVWNEQNGASATGGGYSDLFGIPEFQAKTIGFHHPHRGVPDISANSGIHNGYQIVLNGQKVVVGGTSAATPLWAALIALLNEKLCYRLGFCSPLLYGLANSKAFNQVVNGNNNYFYAEDCWNPCTGLGTPNGCELFDLINEY